VLCCMKCMERGYWPDLFSCVSVYLHGQSSFEKLIVAQLVKKCLHFYGTQRFHYCVHNKWLLATFLIQMNSDLVVTPYVSGIHLNILFLCLCLPNGVFLQVFRPKFWSHFSSFQWVLHALPVLFSYISSP
jgi:hypothetical protein